MRLRRHIHHSTQNSHEGQLSNAVSDMTGEIQEGTERENLMNNPQKFTGAGRKGKGDETNDICCTRPGSRLREGSLRVEQHQENT